MIAELTGYTPQSATAYASNLERRGLVRRHRYEGEDATYEFTEVGVELFGEIIDSDASLQRMERRQRSALRSIDRQQAGRRR
ncbi:hypothetical protein [Bradyrhizobium embrapense]